MRTRIAPRDGSGEDVLPTSARRAGDVAPSQPSATQPLNCAAPPSAAKGLTADANMPQRAPTRDGPRRTTRQVAHTALVPPAVTVKNSWVGCDICERWHIVPEGTRTSQFTLFLFRHN